MAHQIDLAEAIPTQHKSGSESIFWGLTSDSRETSHFVLCLLRFFDVFAGLQPIWTSPSASSYLTMYIATYNSISKVPIPHNNEQVPCADFVFFLSMGHPGLMKTLGNEFMTYCHVSIGFTMCFVDLRIEKEGVIYIEGYGEDARQV